jgi:IclR family transcriptional regulator, pca regulon regulatory protein
LVKTERSVDRGVALESASSGSSGDPDFMLSLARGLAVIRAFGEGKAALGMADVARLTGISRAAARRCLHTLSVLGYASGADGTYVLTPAVLGLGEAYLGSDAVTRAAQPILERVSDRLHESSSMAVLDGQEIVYVARVATRRILSIGLAVGSRLPAASTSMGRAILAFTDAAARTRFLGRVKLERHTPHTIVDKTELAAELTRIHRLGYAIVDQELELGLRSMAVPILRSDGTAAAAINVGVHAGRVDRRTLERDVLPVLQDAAREIAFAAGLSR